MISLSYKYYVNCSRCQVPIRYSENAPRMIQCAFCELVQPTPTTHQLATDCPKPDLNLKQQCKHWNTIQVQVFLTSLQLAHLKPYFEYHHVDGSQLLSLTYMDLKDVFGLK